MIINNVTTSELIELLRRLRANGNVDIQQTTEYGGNIRAHFLWIHITATYNLDKATNTLTVSADSHEEQIKAQILSQLSNIRSNSVTATV